MVRRWFVVALVACSVTLGACGGSGRLAPLENNDKDVPSTTATTAPATAVREVLKALVDVAPPSGYEQLPPDLDTDPGSLSDALRDQFDGAGFVWGMHRNWVDDHADGVTLFVYAFADPTGAAHAFECGCGGDPVPGLPGALISRDARSAELSLAAGSFLVIVYGHGPAPASTADLAAVAGVVRTRVLALGHASGGVVGGASSGGTAV